MAFQKKDKPMSLDQLPEYLKSIRNKNNDQDCLVDVGQISTPMKWSHQMMLSLAVFMSVVGLSVATYKLTESQEVTVVFDVNDQTDARSIAKIVEDNGGQMIDVKQTQESTYEVKISTRKNIKAFLDWLKVNKNFNKVIIKDE